MLNLITGVSVGRTVDAFESLKLDFPGAWGLLHFVKAGVKLAVPVNSP